MNETGKYSQRDEFLKSMKCEELVQSEIDKRRKEISAYGFFHFIPTWNKSGEIFGIKVYDHLKHFMDKKADVKDIWHFSIVVYGPEIHARIKVPVDRIVDFLHDQYAYNRNSI